MKRIVLTFGLIAGGVLSAMMAITTPFADQIGFDKGAIIGYTSMVVAFLMVFFGIRSYRDGVGKGAVSFGRAFRIGITITAIASVCYVATWQVVYYNFAPDFTDKYAAYALEKDRAAGKSEQELAAKAEELAKFKEMYKNPLVNIGLTFLEPLPVGLLMTLVAAGILRREARVVET